MTKRQSAPEVNAGSMADIAFLLLIFFLVTTVIETDSGLNRQLPPMKNEPFVHKKRNILPVLIDFEGKLLVNNELTDLKNLKALAIAFIDNGGAKENEEFYCDYCLGERGTDSSENPKKAIIAISNSREASYGSYIAVQNEVVAAYNALRNREANTLYKMDYTLMETAYQNPMLPENERTILKERITNIRSMYPMNISEAELKNY